MIKNIKRFIQCGLVVLVAFTMTSYAANKNGQSLDRIVVVVNDAIITQSELTEAMNTIKQQLKGSNVPIPANNVFRKQVLDQLINKKLQTQMAEQMGITIVDEDVNKAIKMIASNNRITVNELYQKLSEQGMNRHAYLKEIREQLLLQKVQQQSVGSKINISPEEVDDFMRSKMWLAYNNKEYHLEDILITLPETPSPQEVGAAKKRAEILLTKIHNGLGFNEAAVAESGEHNALQGGDLGWKKLPEIPSVFANDLINMKSGELLGPVQTPNGFHIIHLAGIRTGIGKQPSATQQREQVQQLIFQRKVEEGLQSWITKLRGEAFINMNPES